MVRPWRAWLALALVLVLGGQMAVAPRVMAWRRRAANTPGPMMPGSSPIGGVPFLTSIFGPNARIAVRFAWGADLSQPENTWTWYDVTTDLLQGNGRKILISPMGRADETSQAQPAGCTFVLYNTSGDYTNSPLGKNWPYVRRNTPVQVLLNLTGQPADTEVRFQGLTNGFTPSWDTSAKVAVVTVSASGILRRMAQGKSPLRSPLYRQITRDPIVPLNYWSFEDGSSATQAAEAFGNGTAPISFSQVGNATAAYPKFASLTPTTGGHQAGSSALPDFSNDAQGKGVAVRAASTNDYWAVDFVAQVLLRSSSSNVFDMLTWNTGGTALEWTVTIDNVGGVISIYNDQGTLPVLSYDPGDIFDGLWHYYRLTSAKSGANVVMTLYLDNVQVATTTINSFTMGAIRDIGPFRGFGSSSDGRSGFGHLAVYDRTPPVNNYTAWTGWLGETCTARLIRLCGEEGVPLVVTGASTDTMGPQGVDTLLNLLRECEATDHGMLADGLSAGLRYVARSAKYNLSAALSVDVALAQLDDPFAPVDDDQRNRNLYKVDRKNGSSATFEDTDSATGTAAIGTYDSSATINIQTDEPLYRHAAFLTRLGAVDGLRYPTLGLNFRASPALAAPWLAAGDSARADVLNVSSKAVQHPPGTVSLLIEGYAEALSPQEWTVVANCSPVAPWMVWKLQDPVLGRLDSTGVTVASVVAVGGSSIPVNVVGRLITTTAGDFNVDLNISGIKVTATGCSGGSSPQTLTVDPATVIKQLNPGDQVKLWQPAVPAL